MCPSSIATPTHSFDRTKQVCNYSINDVLIMIIHIRLNRQLSSIQQFQVFMLFIGILDNEHVNTEDWSVHVVKHLSRIALQDDDSEMITDSKSDSLLILTCLHNCLEIIDQENVYKVHVCDCQRVLMFSMTQRKS